MIPAPQPAASAMHPATLDLSIITVSYNVRDLLQRCIASVEAALDQAGLQGEMLVVDNASTDGTLDMLEQYASPDRVRVLASKENLGFTRGNNRAIGQAGGRYVMLLNPDTELQPDVLSTLIRYMDAHPDIGVVGPRLRYGDGSVQSSRRRFPTLLSLLIESTVLQRWLPNTVRDYYVADRPDDIVQEVDWLVGACLVVRREAIEHAGVLDERFFMYSEELDWCRRIKQAGWKIVYNPDAEVIHYEGRSSEQNVLARHVFFNNSKLKYTAKYHGRVAALVLRLWLVLNFLFLVAEDGIKYILIARNRVMRRARIAQLLVVCRWLMTGRTGRDTIDQRL